MYSESENVLPLKRAVTVSRMTAYLKAILDEDVILSDALVTGEACEVKRHYSGHIYFTLKDAGASMSAVVFRQNAEELPFDLANGQKIVCAGRIGVYEKTGRCQFYVDYAEPAGAGSINADFEKLKQSLSREGLFDVSRKKPLPERVNVVAVVTSPAGAAVRDIINVISRRSPRTVIVIAPAKVQGEGAARSVAAAITAIDAWGKADVMIVGRGGGSEADLAAFNEEATVRAVFAANTPVISAVGHETDTTLTDFAADLRAPTPSAAAELAVKDENVSKRDFLTSVANLNRAAANRLSQAEAATDTASARLESAVKRAISRAERRLTAAIEKLELLSPMSALSRGFTIAERNGEQIMSVNQISTGDELILTFKDGAAAACIGTIL